MRLYTNYKKLYLTWTQATEYSAIHVAPLLHVEFLDYRKKPQKNKGENACRYTQAQCGTRWIWFIVFCLRIILILNILSNETHWNYNESRILTGSKPKKLYRRTNALESHRLDFNINFDGLPDYAQMTIRDLTKLHTSMFWRTTDWNLSLDK